MSTAEVQKPIEEQNRERDEEQEPFLGDKSDVKQTGGRTTVGTTMANTQMNMEEEEESAQIIDKGNSDEPPAASSADEPKYENNRTKAILFVNMYLIAFYFNNLTIKWGVLNEVRIIDYVLYTGLFGTLHCFL